MSVLFERTKGLEKCQTHYCPGCSHGVVHRLLGECLEEMDALDRAVGISPVGCAVFAYKYFAFDGIQAAHGRAPAVATGIKRADPEKLVISYQGDGDLASIGAAEIVHAAARGEKITTIFINNAIYGMTGGQMAPTTLPGMRATTAPMGRDVSQMGYPIRVSEMLSVLDGSAYIERVAVNTPANVQKAKKAIRRALEVQKEGLGFSMIEVVSSCPTNWGKNPVDSLTFVKEKMIPYYPLGIFKDKQKEV